MCPARHRLDLPLWKTQWEACPGVAGAAGVSDTRRGACPVGRLPTLPLACCLAPYPPSPLPRWGRGRPRLFHARGFAPCIPAPEPEAALTEPAKQVPGGRNPRLPQKRQEAVPYEQCRQPRRGGTGGDGTIRRKRRRRLRWSSPPGQGEPVPRGFSPGDARGGAPCIK